MKKGVLKVGLGSLLAVNLLLAGDVLPPQSGVIFAAETKQVQAEVQKVIHADTSAVSN